MFKHINPHVPQGEFAGVDEIGLVCVRVGLQAWDSETFLITPGNLTPQLVCVQWQHCELGPTGRWKRNPARVMGGSLEDIDAGANFIRALIEESDVVLITHNGPFDYAVLLRHFPDLAYVR